MGNPVKPLSSLGLPARKSFSICGAWLEQEGSERRYRSWAKETSSAKHFETPDSFNNVPPSAVDQGELTTARAPRELPFPKKVTRTMRWLPAYAWQRVARRMPSGSVHLMIVLADHFEPSIVPHDGSARAPQDEQERRVECWCREYPLAHNTWRDHEDRPFVHTYFYPAEQYDKVLLQRLASLCKAG